MALAAQPPLALPMGELARLKAVTERVPGRNHGTYSKFATAHALSVSHSLDSSPKVGAKGGCAAGFAWTYPLGWAGGAAAPWLSLWESWHGASRD